MSVLDVDPVPATKGAPTPWAQVAAVVVLLTVAVGVLLTAFGLPAVRSSVHAVPIALAGPSVATDRIAAALEERRPGAFETLAVPDTAAAEAAIVDREVYGAIDVSGGRPEVVVATAASPAVAQTLQALAAGLAAPGEATAPSATVRELVPLPAADPRGIGLAAGSLPLVIGGVLAAVVLTLRVRGAARRLVGALAFAMTGGLALAAILQFWFGSLGGDYWTNAGAVALSVAATALILLGLEAVMGLPGIGLGAAVLLLVGNPLSGSASAPEMLPGWSGTLGQLLPPGAGASLLRSTAFFDGAGATQPVLVLLAWFGLGLVLFAVGAVRSGRARLTVARRESTVTAAPV